jgi:hypothetical protein
MTGGGLGSFHAAQYGSRRCSVVLCDRRGDYIRHGFDGMITPDRFRGVIEPEGELMDDSAITAFAASAQSRAPG